LSTVPKGKWVGSVQSTPSDKSRIENDIDKAKKDMEKRNELLMQYKPFMIKVTSKVCKQYIDVSRDEYSIALEAFNEAIETYHKDHGSHFLSFAEMVIRRRVIDYIRKETRQTRDIFLEQEKAEDEEQPESYAQVSASLSQFTVEQENERRKEDIVEYKKHLSKFDISFTDLIYSCPKHIDARDNAKRIARLLAADQRFVDYLLQKKQLPMKDLLKFVKCSRKTIERNRKYIIAMVLI
jgi:RNA polymerase sigma factor